MLALEKKLEDLQREESRIASRTLDHRCTKCNTMLESSEVDTNINTPQEIKNALEARYPTLFQKFHLDHEGNRCGPVEQILFH